MLEHPLSNKALDVRPPQKMVGAFFKIYGTLVSHDLAAVLEHTDFDAHFLGGLYTWVFYVSWWGGMLRHAYEEVRLPPSLCLLHVT